MIKPFDIEEYLRISRKNQIEFTLGYIDWTVYNKSYGLDGYRLELLRSDNGWQEAEHWEIGTIGL